MVDLESLEEVPITKALSSEDTGRSSSNYLDKKCAPSIQIPERIKLTHAQKEMNNLFTSELKNVYREIDKLTKTMWGNQDTFCGRRRQLRSERGLGTEQWKQDSNAQLGYGEVTKGAMTHMLTIMQNISKLIPQTEYHKLIAPPTEYDLKEDSVFIDIGSGFGKPVYHAALQTNCYAHGIEIVPARIEFTVSFLLDYKERQSKGGGSQSEGDISTPTYQPKRMHPEDPLGMTSDVPSEDFSPESSQKVGQVNTPETPGSQDYFSSPKSRSEIWDISSGESQTIEGNNHRGMLRVTNGVMRGQSEFTKNMSALEALTYQVRILESDSQPSHFNDLETLNKMLLSPRDCQILGCDLVIGNLIKDSIVKRGILVRKEAKECVLERKGRKGKIRRKKGRRRICTEGEGRSKWDSLNMEAVSEKAARPLKATFNENWGEKVMFFQEDANIQREKYHTPETSEKHSDYSHVYSYNKIMHRDTLVTICHALNNTDYKVLAWYFPPKYTYNCGLRNFKCIYKMPMHSTGKENFWVHFFIRVKPQARIESIINDTTVVLDFGGGPHYGHVPHLRSDAL